MGNRKADEMEDRESVGTDAWTVGGRCRSIEQRWAEQSKSELMIKHCYIKIITHEFKYYCYCYFVTNAISATTFLGTDEFKTLERYASAKSDSADKNYKNVRLKYYEWCLKKMAGM